MKRIDQQIRLSATDLSNHLGCRHLTALDLQVALGERPKSDWAAPDLQVIRELGVRHETKYLEHLQDQGLRVVNLKEVTDEAQALRETLAFMAEGVDVIAQGALGNAQWFGRPDVLRRVTTACARWLWSYEALDTKLARETKAGSILQLSLYSDLLRQAQGIAPEFLWVIPPGENYEGEQYRVAEYAAYFRLVRDRLLAFMKNGAYDGTYPEPVPHCNICHWFSHCDAQRHADDHLSLVAGIRRQQRDQLTAWNVPTTVRLAQMPLPVREKPKHGSRESYERVREQARVQVIGRAKNQLVYELLPFAEANGLARLPEPSAGDVFLDLEGDAFTGEHGQEYLFGFAVHDAAGKLRYQKRWALNAAEERRAFEWLADEIMRRWQQSPGMHVYHFGAYEPGAMKRLMGRYATREDEIDRMLRSGRFVDLHQAFKQAVRASVEEYSLKKLEAIAAFVRQTKLDEAGPALRYVEHRLELGRFAEEELSAEIRELVEGYNADDCLAAGALRDWLESRRSEEVAKGAQIPRPKEEDAAPAEDLDERQKRTAALAEQLTKEIPAERAERCEEQQARWLLAQLLDWHRRENKAAWWEGYRLRELDDDALLEERAGLAGLLFLERLAVENKIPVDRCSFEKQDTDARRGDKLYCKGQPFGEIRAIDLAHRTFDVKKTRKTADLHPSAVYLWDRPIDSTQPAGSLFRIAFWVVNNGIDAVGPYRAARDLLLRRPPRLSQGETLLPLGGETPLETARRVGSALDHSVLAIQGPPGAGKTFAGARMICDLVQKGKRVGVSAHSHKVIGKLLSDVQIAAAELGIHVPCVRKVRQDADDQEIPDVERTDENEIPIERLLTGKAAVAAGTAWMWSRPEYAAAVDVLFIDEAGQLSLADIVAASQAATNLVLIGDPQQLEQPLQGSHPEGAEKSALEHLLGEHKTITPDLGLLLPETRRLHPDICRFTSELFYEGRLTSYHTLRNRVLEGHRWLSGAGLCFVPVAHEGNRTSSAEEVEVVVKIVRGVLLPGVRWFRSEGNSRPLALDDVLIVAPYNAQVSDLMAALPGARVGTVDKFQGQEAPVVIYSLTTSSPEDAPRGMEFLYSLNRLNVATSRAMSNVIIVGSPRLLEPECRTPRQMQLANALCRYLEMATVIESENI